MKPTNDEDDRHGEDRRAASNGLTRAAPPLRLDRHHQRRADRQERPEEPDEEPRLVALRDRRRRHRRRSAAGPRRRPPGRASPGRSRTSVPLARGLVRAGQRQPVGRGVDLGFRDRAADPEAGDRGVAPGVAPDRRQACRPPAPRQDPPRPRDRRADCAGSVGDVGAGRIGQLGEGDRPADDRHGVARFEPCFAIRPPSVRVAHAGKRRPFRPARGRAAARRLRRRGRARRPAWTRRGGCRARPARRPTSRSPPGSAAGRRTSRRAGRRARSQSHRARGSRSTAHRRSRDPGLAVPRASPTVDR